MVQNTVTIVLTLIGAGMAGFAVAVPWEEPKSAVLLLFSFCALVAAMLSSGTYDDSKHHNDEQGDGNGRNE